MRSASGAQNPQKREAYKKRIGAAGLSRSKLPLADGNGYITEFILLSAGDPAAATLHYFGSDGTPLSVAR